MFDLLTVEEDEIARSQGWELALVYDLSKKKWAPRVLGIPGAIPNSYEASSHVLALARGMNEPALKALRLVAHNSRPK